jgi:hypothetical protein
VTGRDRGNPTSCGAELPFRSQAGRDATSQTEWARSRCAARGLDSCADRRGYGLDPRSYRADRPKQQRPADEGEALMMEACATGRAPGRTMVYRPVHPHERSSGYTLDRPRSSRPRLVSRKARGNPAAVRSRRCGLEGMRYLVDARGGCTQQFGVEDGRGWRGGGSSQANATAYWAAMAKMGLVPARGTKSHPAQNP